MLRERDAIAALDDAHEKGFHDLMDRIEYGECGPVDWSPIDASEHLFDSMTKGYPTDYHDPHVAAAYMVRYHLPRCRMAYLSFRTLFAQIPVPDELYVCDLAAGTGAGMVGLAWALSEHETPPLVYFDHLEPSWAMLQAGLAFVQSLHHSFGPSLQMRFLRAIPPSLPDGLSDEALRIVSAFHLSLPWDSSRGSSQVFGEALSSIQHTIRFARPQAGLFTCHSGKSRSLLDALDHCFWADNIQEFPFPNDYLRLNPSSFYTDCAPRYGFPVENRGQYRFGLPKDSVLMMKIASSLVDAPRGRQGRPIRDGRRREDESQPYVDTNRVHTRRVEGALPRRQSPPNTGKFVGLSGVKPKPTEPLGSAPTENLVQPPPSPKPGTPRTEIQPPSPEPAKFSEGDRVSAVINGNRIEGTVQKIRKTTADVLLNNRIPFRNVPVSSLKHL